MYVGCYDAPVRDLGSYRLRLEELARLGFSSVGLAIDWNEHPADLDEAEKAAIDELVRNYGLEVRLHPDLGRLQQRAQQEKTDLLVYARKELEPLIEWGLRLRAFSICCDSIRAHLEETVAVFRLMLEMSRGTQLKFGVENSQRGVINSPEMLNRAVEMVGDERMGVLVDVGHINTTVSQGWIACESVDVFIEGLDVPIWDTHVHSNDGTEDAHLTVRDGAGSLDMVALVEGFRALGYAGPLNFECKRGERTFAQIEEIILDDRKYLEEIIGRVGAGV